MFFLTATTRALQLYEGIWLQSVGLSPFNSTLITVSALLSVFQLNDTSTGHVHFTYD